MSDRDVAEASERSNERESAAYSKVLAHRQNIVDQLSEDDLAELADKWGDYDPYDMVTMERLYQQYADEYEMSVDREQALKNICKLSLKMDKAIDENDLDSYGRLSAAYDKLRKSSKFTDAQKKEQKARDIDSIGQLVEFVEREGGIIPDDIGDPIEEPQDKVDFMIKDMKNYVDNLVKNELGLGNLIESFIKKEEKNKVSSVDEIIAKGFDSSEVTQQDDEDFQSFLLDQVDKEMT